MADPSATRAPQFGEIEQYRRPLTAYCYRLLASPFDAEDAVQESFVRAWRNLDGFEGRAALKSWLLAAVHPEVVRMSKQTFVAIR